MDETKKDGMTYCRGVALLLTEGDPVNPKTAQAAEVLIPTEQL